MIRALRFLHAYLHHPCSGVAEEEAVISAPGGEIPATIYRPLRPGHYPGWVVLHGITVPGRAHPSLRRFARSVAGAGGVVMVPEIEAWRELRVDPDAADRVIAAAAAELEGAPGVRPGGVGVVGFSFGATQAIITAARPEMATIIRRVVAFGGYCDLRAAFVYSFTGLHEGGGAPRRSEPDPYGRWILTANFLTAVPEHADAARVAAGAHRLALAAGQGELDAGHPRYDPLKAEIRGTLEPEERALWDLIAPPAGRLPDEGPARTLALRLADAALARHPVLDPRPVLPQLRLPLVLAHGYHDRLIPYTETIRLRRHLSPHCPAYLGVSRLFAHSRGAAPLRPHEYPLETARYLRLLARALSAR